MTPSVVWEGEMPVPKSATKAVATFRLVQVRDKEFVCERASRDAVGSVSWTADKDALTQCLCLALVKQIATTQKWLDHCTNLAGIIKGLEEMQK